MRPMTPRFAFAAPFALAALLAFPARSFGQDAGSDEEEAKAAEPIPKKPKVDEPAPEVKGNRFRIVLKSGARIEGILPQGVVWEKRDQLGEFTEASETEKGAGLRLNYVLNMEGDIFIQKKDIEEVKDLGALTDEQKRAIKEAVLTARKKLLEERERINREELARIAAASKEAEKAGKGGPEAKKETEADKKAAKEEKDKKRGDELLKKFPPDEWSPKKIDEIKQRSVINGIFPTADEQEFIDNIELWKAALARQEKADKEGEEGAGEGTAEEGKKDEGGDAKEGSGDETKGDKVGKGDKKKDKEKVPPAEFKKKGE